MNKEVAAPLPGATVMLLRPTSEVDIEGAYEVFMELRHSRSRFLPEFYVFPGGKLEPQDSQPAALALLRGLTDSTPLYRDLPQQGAHEHVLPLSRAEQAGLYFAVFRELFEEAGVLLAVHQADGTLLDLQDEAEQARFASYRQDMIKGEGLSLTDILTQEGLALDFGRLIYFSHWITPPSEPMRVDTRFFLCSVPSTQVASSDQHETTAGYWISPREALEQNAQGKFPLIYPTLLHVRWLAAHPTIGEALVAARQKQIIPAMPDHTLGEDGKNIFSLPAEVVDRW